MVVWWNATARSIAFFLSSTLLFFFLFPPLSLFPLHFPFCGCEASEAGRKKKRKEREKQASISPARRQQQPLFYLASEGPDDSSGQARWMKRRSVWGGGGWGLGVVCGGAYQGTRHRYLLETARRCLCASENSHGHCWARRGDGDLGGIAQLRASASRGVFARAPTVCVQ